jgi:hypothetical protein
MLMRINEISWYDDEEYELVTEWLESEQGREPEIY